MTAAKKTARKSPPETTPTSTQLEEATRKSALAKTKAREAKAAFKHAKKAFKLARKAAKATRKKAEALQEAIARAEEAAVAARRAGTVGRTPRKGLQRASAGSDAPLPVKPKAARKRSENASPAGPDADASNPIAASEGSTPATLL